jgi:hypothetical protein
MVASQAAVYLSDDSLDQAHCLQTVSVSANGFDRPDLEPSVVVGNGKLLRTCSAIGVVSVSASGSASALKTAWIS